MLNIIISDIKLRQTNNQEYVIILRPTFSMVSIGVVLVGPGLVFGAAWVPVASKRMVRKTSMMILKGSFYSAPCETVHAFLRSQFKHFLGSPAEEEKSVGWGYPNRKNTF